jgi:hypothetical protein
MGDIYDRFERHGFTVGIIVTAGFVLLFILFALIGPRNSNRIAAPTDATGNADATAVVLALRCLRSVEPGWIELRHLSAMAGATPGTLALELSGNPSVEYREGPPVGVRFYRFVKDTP